MALLELIWDYAVPALILLTVLVFVHELGHYCVARLCGVRVEVFSIGFGSEIYGWTAASGTRWKFSAIPLGGYVKMYGETTASGENPARAPAAGDEESFAGKPLYQRAAIVLAGPAANFLFAIVIYATMFVFVGQSVTPPRVMKVAEGSAAAAAGFEVGDVIKRINGTTIDRFEEIGALVQIAPGSTMRVVVERDGRELVLNPRIGAAEVKDITGAPVRIGRLGIEELHVPPVVGNVLPDRPAARAGFRSGDLVLRIDDEKIESFEDISRIVRVNPGVPLQIEIRRDGQTMTLEAVPEAADVAEVTGRPAAGGAPEKIGLLGINNDPPGELRKYDPATALWLGVQRTYFVSAQTLQSLGQMITGTRSVKELGGPIRIGQISGDVARMGVFEMIFLAALLSVNLGLINLFPVPMLDGGHLAFYAVEAVRGRPLGERAQEYGFRIGLALVLTLMMFVTWNDLSRLPIIDFFVGLVT